MIPARAALARLREGNARFAADVSRRVTSRRKRRELTAGQAPFAIVLGCSDSRVPAEILFDQGLGDLFVVRTAGHVVDAAVLGSAEYAVEILGVSLIVVLGHEECGAIAAATRIVDDGLLPPGYIRDVAERIAPNVLRARNAGARTAHAVGGQHSLYTAEFLRQRSVLVDDAIRRGAVDVVAAQYSLQTGEVTEVLEPAAMRAA